MYCTCICHLILGMKSCSSFSDMECFSCEGRKKTGLQFAVKAFGKI